MSSDLLVEALVEVPKGSRNKYEFDFKKGRLRLDRVLHSPLHYPADYGLIPETLAEDGDHLDILILNLEPTFPGCIVDARIIGMIDMRDDKGRDQKILAVPEHDPRFDQVTDLGDVSFHLLEEIKHFFQVYKTLEDKQTEILGMGGPLEAWKCLAECRERYAAQEKQPG